MPPDLIGWKTFRLMRDNGAASGPAVRRLPPRCWNVIKPVSNDCDDEEQGSAVDSDDGAEREEDATDYAPGVESEG